MDQPLSPSKKPLVSVLVVTYNQEAYIAHTLDSLLNQDCDFGYEILVGEDCSTDGTRTICEAYASKYPDRIRLFANTVNLGLVPNYLNLIRAAAGTYLADCGGDDYWIAPDKLRQQVAILESHPDVTLVAANWQLLQASDGCISPNQLNLTADWYDPERFGLRAVADYLNRKGYPPVVLSSACLRASLAHALLNQHPEVFDGSDAVCEDLPLTLWLLAQGPFYVQQAEVMVYRKLGESVSHTRSPFDLQKGFANQSFWQTWSLVQALGLHASDLAPYLKRQWNDMVHAAFMTEDRSWMRLQRQRLRVAGLGLSFRDTLKVILLSVKPLYRFVMSLRSRNRSTH
jgi:glycosyltransferase involved in cell wall biosynthesis